MQLEDGTGSGNRAKVNSNNKLQTYSVIENEQLYINEHTGQAYSLLIDVDTDGDDNCFLYIKNTDDKELLVSSVKIKVNAASEIYFKLKDVGTMVGGNSITPVSRNASSGILADAICEMGADITGLAGGAEIDRFIFGEANTNTVKFSWSSGIIIPKNNVFTGYAFVGGSEDVNVAMTISMYYHS